MSQVNAADFRPINNADDVIENYNGAGEAASCSKRGASKDNGNNAQRRLGAR